ncbi:hypothetical protein JMN32_04800 [Fulvivirga sp. 29W222]|uniref:Uncharacterized protein n=1 Tax=Fulvivirga marina TaxID=2494733 RepID=A0A937FTI8_9BACT|nr:hypothetical protein [Fulvivirga marina]MBL6445615.1 hypothetical protein [Fulvivirga marina]
MLKERQPDQMIEDQITLLNSEENKLRKFLAHNEEAKASIDVYIKEIQQKKKRLYSLCEMMGIDNRKNHEDKNSAYDSCIPQPAGRFGSRLISGLK